VLGELAELEQAIHGAKRGRTKLRITASCFTAYHWLPAALAHFGSAHPEVELDVVLEATRRVSAALASDEIDLAITTDPPREDSWDRTVVIESELVVLASPAHPIVARARRGALRWGELRDCEILVYDIGEPDLQRLEHAVRESWRRASGERLTTPLEVRRMPLSEALLELVRGGHGVGLVDRWTVASRLDRAVLALPLAPSTSRTFHAVWRRGNPRELPISDLVDVIRREGGRAVRRSPSRGGPGTRKRARSA
jgi:LysR family transcriptional regulator for metE and metH